MTEEHIIIDKDRFITVPEELKRIAVQHDHNIETVTFDCPRYWDGLDMSKMTVYINYMCKDKSVGMCLAKNVTIDPDDPEIMHFDWTISKNASKVSGELSFLVCIKKIDEFGLSVNHWNSELNQEMYISEGLECAESTLEAYPDIITHLLTRMNEIEGNSEGFVRYYIDEYFADNPLGIDKTLTGDGKPADALAVGVQVERLDGRVDDTNARIDDHETVVQELDTDVNTRIEVHNTSRTVHADIRQELATVKTAAYEAMTEAISHRAIFYETTVTTNWIQDGAYFYQDIAIDGILGTDRPRLDILPGDDNALNEVYDECMSKVFRITSSTGSVRIWAYKTLNTAFPIQLEVNR